MPKVSETLARNYIEFEGKKIEAIKDDELYWFNLKDLAVALDTDIPKLKKAIAKIHIKQFHEIETREKGKPHDLFVREPGLIDFALSQKPPATRLFARFMILAVLPGIVQYDERDLKRRTDSINALMKDLKSFGKEFKAVKAKPTEAKLIKLESKYNEIMRDLTYLIEDLIKEIDDRIPNPLQEEDYH